MANLDKNPQKVHEPQLTYSDMQDLLEPLHGRLQRMENTMQEVFFSLTATGSDRALAQSVTREPKAENAQIVAREFFAMKTSSASEQVNHPVDEAAGHDGLNDIAKKQAQEEPPAGNAKSPRLKRLLSIDNVGDDLGTSELLDRLVISQVLEDGNFAAHSYADKFVVAVATFVEWWGNLKEPQRTGLINRLVSSSIFETLCLTVIMFNALLLSYVTDFQMKNEVESETPDHTDILEKLCVAYFTVELMLRLWAHGCYFFVHKDMGWNIFDTVLVSFSLMDVVAHIVIAETQGTNVAFMRLLRLLKLARVFRSLRSFRFFKELAVLLTSFQKSVQALLWAFIAMVFVMYLFSLIFMQALVEYLVTENNVDPLTRGLIQAKFGTLSKTMVSLYMVVTGGESWVVYYDIISHAGPMYCVVLLIYMLFSLLALFNIITATLVEKALVASEPDRTDVILNERRKVKEIKHAFMEICKSMDVNKDGSVNWQEFQEWVGNPVMLAYLAHLGLEVHDIELFFNTVGVTDHASGVVKQGWVSIEHLVEGCMHMKGSATALDMQRQLFENKLLQDKFKRLASDLDEKLQALQSIVYTVACAVCHGSELAENRPSSMSSAQQGTTLANSSASPVVSSKDELVAGLAAAPLEDQGKVLQGLLTQSL